MPNDSNPEYWQDYTNLQHVKHALIREYLGGWFPKLGYWSGRILYCDTHAGRGRHDEGQAGSALVALKTLLDHSHRHRILAASEARFILVEMATENAEALRSEVDALQPLPDRVIANVVPGECFAQLDGILAHLRESGDRMAPAFIFVDPYGFKIPGHTLRSLLAAGRVELFINVMWRELDMMIVQARERDSGGMVDTMNIVFGNDQWRTRIVADTADERASQAVELMREAYGAQWATTVRMIGANGHTRYMLVHFTNHEDGRDLMKDAIWKVCPGYQARRSDNPNQTLLLAVEPDLADLENWTLSALAVEPLRWATLTARIRGELWRHVHLNSVIRSLRNDGRIVASDYGERFSEKRNPLLALPQPDAGAAASASSRGLASRRTSAR
jgi:three-Cys-motif partner protein